MKLLFLCIGVGLCVIYNNAEFLHNDGSTVTNDLIAAASRKSSTSKAGGGKKASADHSSKEDKKEAKGHKHKDYFEEGRKGYRTRYHKAGKGAEGGAFLNEHFDKGHHQRQHEAKGARDKLGKFNEKEHFHKGQNNHGYLKKEHKDDFRKGHKFYDDAHREGHHEKGAHFHEHQEGLEGFEKRENSHHSGRDGNAHGRGGHESGGHDHGEVHGHKDHGDHEHYHSNFADYGKKGGFSGGRDFDFEHKH